MNNFEKLGWDHNNAHCMRFEVLKDHIDILGHVNNKVYLDWCELVSWDHSKSLGIDSEKYHEVKCACVVIRNNMEYLGSLFEGENIAISTWITETDSKLRLSRLFQVIRITDNKTIFRSYVDYVCISLNSFKPKRMPNLFQNAYKVTI